MVTLFQDIQKEDDLMEILLKNFVRDKIIAKIMLKFFELKSFLVLYQDRDTLVFTFIPALNWESRHFNRVNSIHWIP